jgi:50S ribosomal protein L16 3-hydroxylase
MYSLANLDKEQFLKEYWQKKPLLIKQGFSNFVDPIDENELAGLTEEGSVDSRIVSFSDNKWQVTHGPFEEINDHCIGAWSLLVQSVDHFVPEADQLMQAFNFIPHWRMDDLMVSYSNQQAGVGPHLDQYDVFIIQGKGSRRWQVGLPGAYTSSQPHTDLSQISSFAPIIDEVLMPGDIIYIPPNHPHNGQALEDCMNYSVGFRAQSQQELLSDFVDFSIEHNLKTERYTDKNLALRSFSGEIKQQEISQFKKLMQNMLETDPFDQWLASYMSQSIGLPQDQQLDLDEYSPQATVELLRTGSTFYRSPGIKPVFVEQHLLSHETFTFYIEGQQFSAPAAQVKLVKLLLSSPSITENEQDEYQNCVVLTSLLTTLVNAGFWYPE